MIMGNHNHKFGAKRYDREKGRDRGDEPESNDAGEVSADPTEVVAPVVVRAPVPASKPVYRVAPGKAVTSFRGIIDAGGEVSERDFAEGSLGRLVEIGAVVKS